MRTPTAFVLALTLASLGAARAADPDPWLGRDKVLHVGACTALAGVGYGGTALLSTDGRLRFGVGAAVALGAGVAKELWDLAGHGDASWRDLAADAVGAALGLLLSHAIDRLAQHLWPPSPATTMPPGISPSVAPP